MKFLPLNFDKKFGKAHIIFLNLWLSVPRNFSQQKLLKTGEFDNRSQKIQTIFPKSPKKILTKNTNFEIAENSLKFLYHSEQSRFCSKMLNLKF